MLSGIANAILLPLRLLCSHDVVNRLRLRSIRDERYDYVQKECRGRLLDIGCGNNDLAKRHGHDSVGVDVFDFGGGAIIVTDTADLPFESDSFETVSFVASLNHIPNRGEVLGEAARVLSSNGRIVLTMLSPFIGMLRHKLAWWDEDQGERGLAAGEEFGLSFHRVVSLLEDAGFHLVKRKRIIGWLNNLYVFEKAAPPADGEH